MNLSLTDLRLPLELLAFVAQVTVAIAAFIALRQLKITKQDMRLRSRREAASLAVSQCHNYMTQVVPLLNKLDFAVDSLQFPIYSGPRESFNGNDLLKHTTQKWVKDWSANQGKVVTEVVDALNSLETFAVYFTQGVADEGVAFTSVGVSYCSNIKKNYAFIASVRWGKGRNPYSNIVELYNLWSKRIDEETLLAEVATMSEKLKRMQSPLSGIKPIGTE